MTLLLIATQIGAFAQTLNRTLAPRERTSTRGTQSPELTLTVSPHNPPVTIPSSGGSFDFTVDIDTTSHLTDVVFADAQNGWVVGYNGTIVLTPTGGD